MHTSTDFVRAICENPADTDLRLIYADWLDEHDDPARAEFIRLQCRIDHLDMGDRQLPMGVGREALFRRESELLADNWVGWGYPASVCLGFSVPHHQCPHFKMTNGTGMSFRRGLVYRIELPSDAFLQKAATLFQTHPIEEVRLTDCHPTPLRDEVGDEDDESMPVWQKLSVTQSAWPGLWRERRYGVPDELWELLPYKRSREHVPDWHPEYFNDRRINTYPPDVSTAFSWLSDACVEWGRRSAGLPSLYVAG